MVRDASSLRLYHVRSALALLGLYTLLAACIFELVTPWHLVWFVPLAYVRVSLDVHELMHFLPRPRINFITRLFAFLDTPFCLGWDEYREIHIDHHHYVATSRDPEAYQIRGSLFKCLLAAIVSPEYAFFRWVRQRKISRRFVMEAIIRGGIFVVLLATTPLIFSYYLLAIRLSGGIAQFVFHGLMHNRTPWLVAFRSQSHPWLVTLGEVLVGSDSLGILRYHHVHHRSPEIHARFLEYVGRSMDNPTNLSPTG